MATGASENMVTFKGWTLPGVIGAGAAQTMMNLHHIKAGKQDSDAWFRKRRTCCQLSVMQAGCEVVALVDAAPRVGGYGVHAAKYRDAEFHFICHIRSLRQGNGQRNRSVDRTGRQPLQFHRGNRKTFDVDTICMAVGLSPMSQLLNRRA